MSRPAEPRDLRHAVALDELAAALSRLCAHPAKLNGTELKVWCAVARGIDNVSLIADLLGKHRNTVSRALSTLRSRGFIRRSPEQARHKGQFCTFLAYEALDERGNPLGR